MKRFESMGKAAIIETMAKWRTCESCPVGYKCSSDKLCSENLRDYLYEELPDNDCKFEHLRMTMIRQEWTNQAMALEIGIEPYTFSTRMSGKSQWKRAEMLAISRVLGCTLDYLFGE